MKGNNLGSIQEKNRSLVLRLLKKQPNCSRVELSKQTGLQQATITNIIGDFIDWGLVKETGMIGGSKGRRSIGLAIDEDNYYVAGLRLTRKHVLVGVFNIIGEAVEVEKVPVNSSEGPQLALEKMKDSATAMIEKHADKNIIALGVSVPGPYFPDQGKLDSITDFPGWEAVNIKEELYSYFDIPVIIDHDARAGALAEWWIAPGAVDDGTIIYIAAGQGVGAGIIHNGQKFRGSLGTAGEIGHITVDIHGDLCACGNRGCLTNYASTTALLREIQAGRRRHPDTVLGENPTVEEVGEAVRQGDALATEAFEKIVTYLCAGINNVVCCYGPCEIIVGDELAAIGEPLLAAIEDNLRRGSIKKLTEQVKIKLSGFALDPAFVGAAALAIDYALNHSGIFQRKGEVG